MKTKLKGITIERLEGPIASCGKPVTFSSYVEARVWLHSCSSNFPKEGYDKHRVTLEFEDGVAHTFRMNCKHFSKEYPDLDPQEHIRMEMVYDKKLDKYEV